MATSRQCALYSLGLGSLFIVAFFIGWGSRRFPPGGSPHASEPLSEQLARLRDGMRADSIRQHLWDLTREPHMAGTAASLRLARILRAQWLSWGVDEAELVHYDVLLSYPDTQRPSGVSLLDGGGHAVFNSSPTESVVPQEHADVAAIVPPFNAFSAQGEPEGELVYVNYGRVEDFALLSEVLHVDVRGRIVVARYGQIFRGNKVQNAERAGALGMLLYSDPHDYCPPGVEPYPAGWSLPPDGVQRGNVLLANGAGDPLTPGYPATEHAFRKGLADGVGLPKIPVHPLSYRDAEELLRDMGGAPPPSEAWRGSLNVSYNVGPGFLATRASWRVRMLVRTQNQVRRIYNVVGTIHGAVEPDRWVILGGHRDTWVFGGIDPMTGAATLQEVAKVTGAMRRSGWRPRRSLKLCSWDAEEFGLQGSTEWVEDKAQVLLSRAVAYINADSAIEGNFTLRVDSSPMLHRLVYSVAKQVPSPDEGQEGRSLYDTWLARDPSSTNRSLPNINKLGSGSDFEAFFQRLGISAARARYTKNKRGPRYSGYPAYHSASETFDLVERFYDGGFPRHLAVARVRGLLALALAAAPLLPLDCRDYGPQLRSHAEAVAAVARTRGVEAGPGFASLFQAIDNFTAAAENFHAAIGGLDMENVMALRMANDRLMLLERAFTDPLGLPGRPFYRHVVFAPSSHNKYAGEAFPGVYDSLFIADAAEARTETERNLAVAAFTVQAAAGTLA
ncbi:putative N-acetylated-alpha-linked acidic dipeptidase isoform X1 [Petromyzon marinus]